jgi:hypothetical protein
MIPVRVTCPHCKAVYDVSEAEDTCRFCGHEHVEVETFEPSSEASVAAAINQIRGSQSTRDPILTMPDLGVAWKAWLRALQESLWIDRVDPRLRRKWSQERRRMTVEEWLQVQQLIWEHDLICSMRNACMGFGCGMAIYEATPPAYPGVPIDPEFVLFVTQEHLPLPEDRDSTHFKDGWEAFSPFTHSDENTKALKANELPEPKPKVHYEY